MDFDRLLASKGSVICREYDARSVILHTPCASENIVVVCNRFNDRVLEDVLQELSTPPDWALFDPRDYKADFRLLVPVMNNRVILPPFLGADHLYGLFAGWTFLDDAGVLAKIVDRYNAAPEGFRAKPLYKLVG